MTIFDDTVLDRGFRMFGCLGVLGVLGVQGSGLQRERQTSTTQIQFQSERQKLPTVVASVQSSLRDLLGS